jgi:predicted ATPase
MISLFFRFFHFCIFRFWHLYFSGVHKFKSTLPPRDRTKNKSQPVDPIPPIATEISEESMLLCFDEFQVRATPDAEPSKV